MAIIAGFVLLVWSADRFVYGAAGIAGNMGMSKMMIGLTIVSLGTSAPEIFVSINAALAGAPEIAIGNAIGSNIANIGLVLGITTLIAPLPVKMSFLRQDIPALLAVTAITGFLIYNLELTRAEGLALIAMAFILLYLMFRYKREHPEELPDGNPNESNGTLAEPSTAKFVFWFLFGLAVLVGSSRLLVWGAVDVARSFGIDEVIIGLTIIATGTSLPELAASITSALRRHHDIALGNIIGSNILNLLTVLSAAAVISPLTLTDQVLFRDYGAMSAMTLLLAIFAYTAYRKGTMARWEGSILLGTYFAYMVWLYLSVTIQ